MVVSYSSWCMIPLMVLGLVVAWKSCPPPKERSRCLMAVLLAVVAIAMNVAFGFFVKARAMQPGAWATQAEERLLAVERAIAIQNNHATNSPAK